MPHWVVVLQVVSCVSILVNVALFYRFITRRMKILVQDLERTRDYADLAAKRAILRHEIVMHHKQVINLKTDVQ